MTTDLTNERLRQIVEAAGKATPGPYEVYGEPDVNMPPTLMAARPSGYRAVKYFRNPIEPLSEDDMAHFANCDPATIAAMAGEVMRLRTLLVNMLDDGDETDREAARQALGATHEPK